MYNYAVYITVKIYTKDCTRVKGTSLVKTFVQWVEEIKIRTENEGFCFEILR